MPDIYEPSEDSYLLQKHINRYAVGRVLDMGTGSGIQALTAIENPNVREVVAVDINEKAIRQLDNRIREMRLRKINAVQGPLFEPVHGKFNLIIFNPPYLPQDKVGGRDVEDTALYGGRQGWEISQQFFQEVSGYLLSDGRILFLFSSLTNKEKIDTFIQHQLLESKEIDRLKLPFEELFVYEVWKSSILVELERRGIEEIRYFTHGKRGDIFIGKIDKNRLVKSHLSKKNIVTVAIKTKRQESPVDRIANEAHWLTLLNKRNIGPRLLFSDAAFCVYEFVEGPFLSDWLSTAVKQDILSVIDNILDQCFIMDMLPANKEEMHHPFKHIVINRRKQPILLDFERCTITEKPKNVTQFIECLCRMQGELAQKDIIIDVVRLRELAKQYKPAMNRERFNVIKKELKQSSQG